MTYHCRWNPVWAIALILAAAFVSPWFLIGLWPLPESWSSRLPATYTKSEEA